MELSTKSAIVTLASIGALAACTPLDPSPSDAGAADGGSTDAGSTDAGGCATPLVTARFAPCSGAGCAGTATRTLSEGELAPDTSWLVVAQLSSELSLNANAELAYRVETAGGLGRAGRRPGRPAATSAKIDAERALRARALPGRPQRPTPLGTAIVSASAAPHHATKPCTAATAATCRDDGAICVIAEGATDGTCEVEVGLQFALNDPARPEALRARVARVGTHVAILLDEGVVVADADLDELVRRFDRHVAPLEHAWFGAPTRGGQDRDGNGVVLALLTSRFSTDLFPATFVGAFFSDDLRSKAEAAHSNAADLLYLRPPGPEIGLDALSGTLAHEYFHLIHHFTKVLVGGGEPESVWLDEGLATFVEEALGYGVDAYQNDAAYLLDPVNTSLTGEGPLGEGDGPARRGMVHLFLRYLFEQAGGAVFGDDDVSGPGRVALRTVVHGPSTGLEALAAGFPGRSFHDAFRGFLWALALDDRPGIGCHPDKSFLPPEPVAFTGFQRGVVVRGRIAPPGGAPIDLTGPSAGELETQDPTPFPFNAGELHTIRTGARAAKVRLIGPGDLDPDLERATLEAVALP